MSYYSDLSSYEYTEENSPGVLLNVGWLDADHPYTTGFLSDEVLSAILKLCENPVNRTRGFHLCPFCEAPSFGVRVQGPTKQILLGSAEIRVAGDNNQIYTAPDLIYHYISNHQYKPPDEFLLALSASS